MENIDEGTMLGRPDTRTISKRWIEANLPSGSKIAYEYYAPHLHIDQGNFTLVNTGWDRIISMPLDHYQNISVDYIVITSAFKSRYYREPDKYSLEISRYEALKDNAELVKLFGNTENAGPVIEIYKLG